jgi:hypothetical protein
MLGALRQMDRALLARGYRHPLELLMTPADVARNIYGSRPRLAEADGQRT